MLSRGLVGNLGEHVVGADRQAYVDKIEAYLADAKRPWAYADSMAKHMFGVDKLAFCHEGQLHKIVAALEIDKRRHPGRPD